jgi:hypothetical protein
MSFSDNCADAPFTKAETPDRLTITASNGEEVLVINFAHDAEEREQTDSKAEGQTMKDENQDKPPERPATQRCPRCKKNAVLGGMLLLDGSPSCGMCAETEDPDATAAYTIGDPLPATDDEEIRTNA